MAENPPITPPKRLPIIPTISGAFQLAWLRRSRLAQAVAVPSLALILIGVYWSYAAQGIRTYDAIVWVLLHTLALTPFAVACHRILLLGEESLPRYGIMGWTKREFRFLTWLVIAMLTGTLVTMIAIIIFGGIVANVFPFSRTDWEGWIGGILMTGCEVLGLYVAARLSLVLPSIALEQGRHVSEVWRVSYGNGLRLTAILGGFPLVLQYAQGLAFPDDAHFVMAVLSSALYCVFLAVEVAALSLSYKAFFTVR